MIKKKIFFILIFALLIVIGGLVMLIVQNKSPDVVSFDVSDYQYFIETFSSEENVGRINDSRDAIIKAENVWIKMYGVRITKEKPYQVSYDEKNEIWLIHGSLKPNIDGGVAYILIENDTGKVIAVWHTK